MAEFRLSAEAEADLDAIWLHIARDSGSIEIANRAVESIAERFWLLAQHPYLGRRRDDDLRPGLRSFPAGEYIVIHFIQNDELIVIVHVLHGSRDITGLFGT